MNCFQNQNKDDALVFSLKEDGAAFQVSRNFRLIEFASKDGADEVKIHPALMLLLQGIRDHFDAAVSINSGFRTASHNAAVGGASESRHVWGMGADIFVRGVKASKVQAYCHDLGVGGIGTDDSFTHVDVEGEDRRWSY